MFECLHNYVKKYHFWISYILKHRMTHIYQPRITNSYKCTHFKWVNYKYSKRHMWTRTYFYERQNGIIWKTKWQPWMILNRSATVLVSWYHFLVRPPTVHKTAPTKTKIPATMLSIAENPSVTSKVRSMPFAAQCLFISSSTSSK